jgi:hypothetical protein
MWPALRGKRVDVDAVADRYTELMLQGLQLAMRSNARGDHEARLARLEALVDAAAPARRRARSP